MTKKFRTALTLSLLLNLALGGLSGTLLWRAGHPPLPPEIADAPPEIARRLEREIPQAIERVRAARADLVSALTAPAFDPQAFDAAAEKLSAVHREGFEARIGVAREIAEKLPQEARKKLAARMFPERRGGGGFGGKRHAGDDVPPPQ